MRAVFFFVILLLVFGCVSTDTCPILVDPVCGIDGKTYSNSCYASLAGVDIQAQGICTTCEDSDTGRDIFARGILSSGEQDSCADDNTVIEYYCDGIKMSRENLPCPANYLCSDGECIPILFDCSDSDNENIFVKGNVTFGTDIYVDSCINLQKLTEFVCDSGTVKNISRSCPGNYLCSDGACSNSSCTDTDGFDIFTAGVVGAHNSTFKDKCVNEKDGVEYRCSEGEADEFIPFTCPDGFHCIDGACQDYCEDLDGGLEYYERGSIVIGTQIYTDVCQNVIELTEYHCAGSGYSITTYPCPADYMCYEGRCVSKLCQDTDEKDIYTTGLTRKGKTEQTDYCVDNSTLKEYFCTKDTIHSIDFGCPLNFVCFEGRCVATTFCEDSDGGIEKFEAGKVTTTKSTGTDFCADSDELNEYYCSSGKLAVTTMDCGPGYICQKGSCIEFCEETDGGKDFAVAGKTYNGKKNQTDYCFNGLQVEYYCSSGFIMSEVHECGSGETCENGICMSSCTDSDNDSKFTVGSVTFGSEKFDDYCEFYGSKKGFEYVCGPEGPVETEFNCPLGFVCHDRACNPKCEDPDVKDMYTKGTTYLGNETKTDECTSERGGTEYICQDGQISETTFTCFMTHTCSEGKCVQETG